MEEAAVATKRLQTRGEEIANSVSHGVGLLAALAAAPILVASAGERGGAATAVGAAVFVLTAGLLYLASLLYHALPAGRAKDVFRLLDHGAIFLLIAGTYTPFTLGVLRGPVGWSLLALIWALAVAGVAAKATVGTRYPRLSLAFYLGMGWLAVAAIRPLWLRMSSDGLAWLVAGGLAYTAGVVFYATDHRLRYGHFVWHLFVLAGTLCHFVAVAGYSA